MFEDDYAITVTDEESDPDEARFVSIGMGVKGRVLVVAYTYRVATVRTISARLAEPHENSIRGRAMKHQYDSSQGKRGRIAAMKAEQGGKTRITIRLDEDLVDYFLKEAERSGGSVGYQTLINDALRLHVEGKAPQLEETLRRVLREEIRASV